MEEAEPRKPDEVGWIGPAGLALAVASFFPHLGLLFLPAAVVSIIALSRKSSAWAAAIGLAAAVVRFLGATVVFPAPPPATPAFLSRPYADLVLANFSLPRLPASSSHIRVAAGGLFAKHVFLVFDAPEADVRDFLRRLGDGEVRRVGPEDCRLLTLEERGKALDRAMREGWDSGQLESMITVQGASWLPWFRPDAIDIGWFMSREDGVEGFTLSYDSVRLRAYFSWHYS